MKKFKLMKMYKIFLFFSIMSNFLFPSLETSDMSSVVNQSICIVFLFSKVAAFIIFIFAMLDLVELNNPQKGSSGSTAVGALAKLIAMGLFANPEALYSAFATGSTAVSC